MRRAQLLWIFFWSSFCIGNDDDIQLFRKYEAHFGIPSNLAYAIAHQESGRPSNGVLKPYRLAANISGRPYYFSDQVEALAVVREAVASGKSVDIGYMQTNWRWQKHRYLTLEESFDAEANIRAGTSYLRELYDTTGSWVEAIARYHAGTISSAEERQRALDYADKVRRHHEKLY